MAGSAFDMRFFVPIWSESSVACVSLRGEERRVLIAELAVVVELTPRLSTLYTET